MNQYILTYRPPRPTFPADATSDESAAIERHFEYLQALLADQRLIIAGRTEDASFGIAVFLARDLTQAEQVMAGDPAIQAGVFSGELKAFRVALLNTDYTGASSST